MILAEDGFVTMEFRKSDGAVLCVETDLYETNNALFDADRRFPEDGTQRLEAKAKVFRKVFGLGDDYPLSARLVVRFCKEIQDKMDFFARADAVATTPVSPASTAPPP